MVNDNGAVGQLWQRDHEYGLYGPGVGHSRHTIDGANSHIAIRVALKSELLVMNSGDTDPTYTETNIP